MLQRLSISAVLLVALAVAFSTTSKSTAETQKAAPSAKLQALLVERKDVLAKRVEYFEAQFQNAQITRIPIYDARDDLFVAELELAESQKQRIELMEARVANLKALEETQSAMVKQRDVPLTDVLGTRSRRLLAQIDLERALSAE